MITTNEEANETNKLSRVPKKSSDTLGIIIYYFRL